MSEQMSEQTRWYALAVRYQHEQQAERALHSKGLETLVPLYSSQRQWSDRVKEMQVPLFAGYVFCLTRSDTLPKLNNETQISSAVNSGFGADHGTRWRR